MKDGQDLGATLCTNSDLPDRRRQGCNFPSTRSRRETYFLKNSSIRMGRTFFGSTACLSFRTLSCGTSAVISCTSVNEWIHSTSW